MSLRMSRRKWEKLTLAEQAAQEAAHAAAEHGIVTRARKVVEIWNARSDLFFFPTIRAAITAGCPWLDYMCPACCRVGEIDLRQVDRHPDASISSLTQELPQLSAKSAVLQTCPTQRPFGGIRPPGGKIEAQAHRPALQMMPKNHNQTISTLIIQAALIPPGPQIPLN